MLSRVGPLAVPAAWLVMRPVTFALAESAPSLQVSLGERLEALAAARPGGSFLAMNTGRHMVLEESRSGRRVARIHGTEEGGGGV